MIEKELEELRSLVDELKKYGSHEPKPTMNNTEAANYIGVSRRTWYTLKSKPAPVDLGGGIWKYRKKDLDKWLDARGCR